jgi:hypothetical protein
MKNLLRVLTFGFLAGFIVGFLFAERQRQLAEKAASDAFQNDPEVIATEAERRRIRQVDDWLDELEE